MIGFVAFGNQDKIHQNILIELEKLRQNTVQ
jgi:hypothetical protein